MGAGAISSEFRTGLAAMGQDSLLMKERCAIAIRDVRLDLLEQIIREIGGIENLSSILPLHIAASYASLETAELLVSAGANVSARDPENMQNALHKCSTNRSINSSLCACFLITISKMLVYDIDINYRNPLQLAVVRNNVGVTQEILSSLDEFDSELVRDARNMAEDLGSFSIIAIIDAWFSSYNEMKVMRDVPMDRTMQIWSIFLSNVFSMLLEPPLLVGNFDSFETLSDLKAVTQLDCDNADGADALLAWVLLYDDFEGYLSVNTCTQEWLHFNELMEIFNDCVEALKPSSLVEAVFGGWMSYYNRLDNSCFWINIFSFRCECALPLDSDWIYADSSVTFAWTIVIDKNCTSCMYYLNYITHDSLPEEPQWWGRLVEAQSGWCLC